MPLPPAVHLPVYADSRPPSPSSPLAAFADALRPRKSRSRVTALALISLLSLSAYILLFAQPSFSAPSIPLFRQQQSVVQDANGSSWRNLAANYAAKNRHAKPVHAAADRPQVALDASQELAAVTSFMAALPQNVIPLSVDPARTIDPQLVLDFDTRSPGAIAEVDEVVRDVWLRNPVVVFSKMRSPISRELKSLIDAMKLRPSPTIFDVDQRDDAEVLIPLLFRLTGASELPVLLVGGKPVGDIDTVRALDASGELRALVAGAGAEIEGARKRKKGRRS